MLAKRRLLSEIDDTEFWLTNQPTIPEMRRLLREHGMVNLLPILNACITAGFDLDDATVTVRQSTYQCADHVGTAFRAMMDGKSAALFWGDPCITSELVVVLKRSDGRLFIRSPFVGVSDELIEGDLFEYLLHRDYNMDDLCFAPWRASVKYQDGSVVLCRRKSRETGQWQYSLFTDWRGGNENDECQYLLIQRAHVDSGATNQPPVA